MPKKKKLGWCISICCLGEVNEETFENDYKILQSSEVSLPSHTKDNPKYVMIPAYTFIGTDQEVATDATNTYLAALNSVKSRRIQ